MHKAIFSAMTALALIGTATAQAAEDPGLRVYDSSGMAMHRSVGGQASVTLRFGDNRVVRGEDRLRLKVSAGPVFVRADGNRFASGLFAASIAPSYKAELAFAGQPVVTHYTKLGLRESGARGPDGERLGFTGKSWVPWVLGGGVALGLCLFWLCDGSDSSSSSSSSSSGGA
jgi:hypothetical protein